MGISGGGCRRIPAGARESLALLKEQWTLDVFPSCGLGPHTGTPSN